jgi:hypothetical protein
MKRVSSWDEWCAIHKDRALWVDEIRAIGSTHRFRVRSVSDTFPGTHAVFFVNDDLVLKLFCPVRYNSCGLERRLHEGPLKGRPLYPPVRFHGTSPSGYDYLAFQRLPGRPVREIDRSAIPAAALEHLAVELAELQADTLVCDRQGAPRCLVHRDLTEDHIFLDGEGRLAGLIDFGDAVTGHPSQDLPVLFADAFDCRDDLIETFTRAYHAAQGHYRVALRDLASATRIHPFGDDIVRHMQARESAFTRRVLTYIQPEG